MNIRALYTPSLLLESERANLFAVCGDSLILRTQRLNPLTRTGLAHLHDHGIITTDQTRISLLDHFPAEPTQCLAVELQHLLNLDILSVDVLHFGRNGDTEEAHTGLTLGVFDDGELGGHGFCPLGYRSLIGALYQVVLDRQPYNIVSFLIANTVPIVVSPYLIKTYNQSGV